MMQTVITVNQEALPVIRSGIELKRQALELSLERYRFRLGEFETRYSMNSEQFASDYAAGKLGDDAKWFEWEFLLDSYRETKRQLKLLLNLHI